MAEDRKHEGELSVEELEEVAGGAETNIYCPTTNKESCNSGCSKDIV
ncbi:MAG TPA: hypothetical protein VGR37_10750 [Longimicrobiaceae bacterium]|nr:hypothetical protein [Longimicrobiaceae bacterium]